MSTKYIKEIEDDGTEVEEFYVDGKLHREDGPAKISRDTKGYSCEIWYLNGIPSRANGPAMIRRFADGRTAEDSFFKNGEPDNDVAITLGIEGSTVIRNANGVITNLKKDYSGPEYFHLIGYHLEVNPTDDFDHSWYYQIRESTPDYKPGSVVRLSDGKGDVRELIDSLLKKGIQKDRILFNGSPLTDDYRKSLM
jgi:hypothetical protein